MTVIVNFIKYLLYIFVKLIESVTLKIDIWHWHHYKVTLRITYKNLKNWKFKSIGRYFFFSSYKRKHRKRKSLVHCQIQKFNNLLLTFIYIYIILYIDFFFIYNVLNFFFFIISLNVLYAKKIINKNYINII